MQPIAGTLKNEDIRNLGAYYASLKPPKPAPTSAFRRARAERAKRSPSSSAAGRAITTNLRAIASSARLASQREDVLLKALRDFKSGARVGSGVASMADVVYPLSDDDMKALAHFMATHP